jgi:hypothetical protein
LRFGEYPENCLNFSAKELIFNIIVSGVSIADSAIWLKLPKRVFFDVLIQGFFCGDARNVNFGM